MKIDTVTTADYEEIVDVWEASVRATHHFLPDSDIEYFKPLILERYLDGVDLRCVRDEGRRIMGFLGVDCDKIEMLFIEPDYFGRGIGRALVDYAVETMKATKVDVNEQNPGAIEFYHHMGFKTLGRSPLDGLGKPYPILHLGL